MMIISMIEKLMEINSGMRMLSEYQQVATFNRRVLMILQSNNMKTITKNLISVRNLYYKTRDISEFFRMV